LDVFKRVWKSDKSEHYPSCVYKDDAIAGWHENYVFKLPSGEIVGMFEDITDRVRAEKQLRDYQTKLKFLASELSLTEDRERRRIATELHDRISQSLVISKVKLQAIREIVDSPDILNVLNEVSDSLGKAIADARSLTFDLSSPILHELGLEAAVYEWLREQIQQKHGLNFEFDDDLKPKPLEDDIRSLLFRDIQEVLVNIVKHAKADSVKVSIHRAGHQVRISIEDDGIGFSVSDVTSKPTRAGGFGLFSIKERLEPLGGRFEIVSEPDQGCKVTIFAPLKESEIINEA
jgi:signal transduction histidine kinase